MIEAMLLATGVFTLFLIAHALIFHYGAPRERWKVVSRVAKIYFLIYTALFWILPFPNWFGLLDMSSAYAKYFAYANGAILYIFLFLSYGQFYFLIDRGVSARILIEIMNSPQKRMTAEEIHARYRTDFLQGRRIDDMIYGGYLVRDGNAFVQTRKGVLMARVFLISKKYFHLYPGG